MTAKTETGVYNNIVAVVFIARKIIRDGRKEHDRHSDFIS